MLSARVIKMCIRDRIDNEYDIMADNADPYVIEKSKKELGQMEEMCIRDS